MLQLHARRRGSIELLLLDVDGVLTDGEHRLRGRRDGNQAVPRSRRLGVEVLARSQVSGRRLSRAEVRRRSICAAELGIAPVFQGRPDKLLAFDRLLAETGLRPDQVCAVGDDLAEVPLCGLRRLASRCGRLR